MKIENLSVKINGDLHTLVSASAMVVSFLTLFFLPTNIEYLVSNHISNFVLVSRKLQCSFMG